MISLSLMLFLTKTHFGSSIFNRDIQFKWKLSPPDKHKKINLCRRLLKIPPRPIHPWNLLFFSLASPICIFRLQILLNYSASVRKTAKCTNDFFDKTKLVYVPKDIQCISTEKLTTSVNFRGENLGMTAFPINNICFRLNEYGSWWTMTLKDLKKAI